MRSMSKIWTVLVVGVSLGLTLIWGNPSQAVPLSNTNISWDYFTSIADVSNPLGELFTSYEFFPSGTPLGDGLLYSAVFPGIGSANGLYVYVYQIQVLRTPSVEGMSIVFITDPTATPVSGITSFYIGSGNPTIGLGLGSYAPANSAWLSVAEGGDPTLRFNQINIPVGGVSYIFGTISHLPPTTIDVTLRDGTNLIVRPSAFTPTPEPSAIALFVAGLLGVAGIPAARRRYKTIKA